jgi:hypothetical protein
MEATMRLFKIVVAVAFVASTAACAVYTYDHPHRYYAYSYERPVVYQAYSYERPAVYQAYTY